MKKVSVREFNNNFSRLLNSGEPFVVTKYGEDFVKVVPIREQNKNQESFDEPGVLTTRY